MESPHAARLPVSTRHVVGLDRVEHRSLLVFCPELEESTSLDRCGKCPRCVGFDAGDVPGARPAVLCGARGDDRKGGDTPVGRVLSRHAACIDGEAPLEALDALDGLQSAGVPVVDDGLHLLGVVMPHESGAIRGPARQRMRVLEATRTGHAAIDERSSVSVALTRMAGAHARRLPVVARDGTVVGVIEDLDALRALAGGDHA
jgi:CBS domain-containing protein